MSYKRALAASAKQQSRNEKAQQQADAAQARRESRKIIKRVTRRIRGGQKCRFCRKEAEFTDNVHNFVVCGSHRNQLED